jgi:tRNA threonylcarbamoyladenosine biosynthesis protein TsaB
MSTLRQVLAAHSPVLLLDAASTRVQVGWIAGGSPDALPGPGLAASWQASEEPATAALFQGIERLGRNPVEAGAFVFCDGPGSVLGIRTAAMALRTWNILGPRPMFAYCSLALVAHAIGRADVGVIADARRESWHHYQIGCGLRRLPAAGVQGELLMPEHFRHWSALPPNVSRVPYLVADQLPRVLDDDLLQPTDSPDAFLHEEPSYVRWMPTIHRAPGERV